MIGLSEQDACYSTHMWVWVAQLSEMDDAYL